MEDRKYAKSLYKNKNTEHYCTQIIKKGFGIRAMEFKQMIRFTVKSRRNTKSTKCWPIKKIGIRWL